MICSDCGREVKHRPDHDYCFRCQNPGFRFVGGGGYGREMFHNGTNAEAIAEHKGGDPTREYEPRNTKAGVWAPVR